MRYFCSLCTFSNKNSKLTTTKNSKFFQGKQPNVRTHCISKQWLKIIWKTYAWKIEKVWCEKTFVSCYVRHLGISCKKKASHTVFFGDFPNYYSQKYEFWRESILTQPCGGETLRKLHGNLSNSQCVKIHKNVSFDSAFLSH